MVGSPAAWRLGGLGVTVSSLLGGAWCALGVLLGCSWVVLVFLGGLGVSWGALGVLLGCLRVLLGAIIENLYGEEGALGWFWVPKRENH